MRYFGVENAPSAIVPGGETTAELDAKLEAGGYEVILPWMSAADKKAFIDSDIRRQVMEQTKGMPKEQQEAIIKMALGKVSMDNFSPGEMSATERGTLTHELSHLWFMEAFKFKGDETQNEHGYGGWAPDWLDETAAILLENETLTESRRKAFAKMKTDEFYPLEQFLAMEHPVLKSAQALKEKYGKEDGGSRAIFLSGEEADEFLKSSGGSDPVTFYTQVRGFADYVIKATGDEQIFAKLAKHLSEAKSFESWLVKTDGLPNNMTGLDESWNDWLNDR